MFTNRNLFPDYIRVETRVKGLSDGGVVLVTVYNSDIEAEQYRYPPFFICNVGHQLTNTVNVHRSWIFDVTSLSWQQLLMMKLVSKRTVLRQRISHYLVRHGRPPLSGAPSRGPPIAGPPQENADAHTGAGDRVKNLQPPTVPQPDPIPHHSSPLSPLPAPTSISVEYGPFASLEIFRIGHNTVRDERGGRNGDPIGLTVQ
eukprot:GHVU01040997.1.p1 GENE.GHVU01040997.1~~GHVU01040997.1.p1  ORF type:complete len:201 (+),score=16.65 GHVU01040997.1:1247-1849(+)